MIDVNLVSSGGGLLLSRPLHNELAPWLALCRVKGLGCVSFKRLAAHFTDPTKAFAVSRAELEQVGELRAETIDNLIHFAEWAEVDNEVSRVHAAGITLIPFSDERYPARLRAIADPPPLLYVKGEMVERDDKAVAIVGSRSASDYGRRVARDLAHGLASMGFTVVSGMARGIDGMAHEAAMNSDGRTLAVLGSGVERAYPA